MIIDQQGFEILKEIFTSAGEGIILSDKQGRIKFSNPRAESIFKYKEGELQEKPVDLLLPDNLRSNHHHHRNDYMDHPKALPMGQGLDLVGDLIEKEQEMLDLAYNTVRKRTADALIKLKERFHQGKTEGPFEFTISREELASMVGTLQNPLYEC